MTLETETAQEFEHLTASQLVEESIKRGEGILAVSHEIADSPKATIPVKTREEYEKQMEILNQMEEMASDIGSVELTEEQKKKVVKAAN